MIAGAAHDVIVAGDGPAAAAVVHECRMHGLDAVAIGTSASWGRTYGMWRDEVPHLPDGCFAAVTGRTVVRARTERCLDRPYGIVDNGALRAHLGIDDVRRHGRVARSVDAGELAFAHLDDGEVLAARWIVDATGRSDGAAWQTAYGAVVSSADLARAGYSTDHATVMAWLPTVAPPCFLYAVPVAHGWLVEITSLVARPAIDPQRLRRVLIDVIGEAPIIAAEALGRTETVRIPMGAQALPTPGGRVFPFGTAGGLAHPATGYSVATSLVAAGRLAASIASGSEPVDAVWGSMARRTRVLHESGLEVVMRMEGDRILDFFEAFYSVAPDLWADYLRVDAPDARVAAAMRAVFRAAPWSVRRRMLGLDRTALGLLVRASVGAR